jgi:hypothetical protein
MLAGTSWYLPLVFFVMALHCLSLSDLDIILRGCPHLQQLAITLCPIDLGSIDDLGADFTLGDNTAASKYTEHEAMLVRTYHYNLPMVMNPILTCTQDIIASLPTLHTLRILSMPVIQYRKPIFDVIKFQTGEMQAIVQRYATQVMAYLVERGSKVKLLALKPLGRHGGCKIKDGNESLLAKLLLRSQLEC